MIKYIYYYTYYKAFSNFPFINPIYIPLIYSKIKNTYKKLNILIF